MPRLFCIVVFVPLIYACLLGACVFLRLPRLVVGFRGYKRAREQTLPAPSLSVGLGASRACHRRVHERVPCALWHECMAPFSVLTGGFVGTSPVCLPRFFCIVVLVPLIYACLLGAYVFLRLPRLVVGFRGYRRAREQTLLGQLSSAPAPSLSVGPGASRARHRRVHEMLS